MTTEDFIITLFCRVDDVMSDVPKHSQAHLYPSEVVTLGLLFALKGVGNRAFYRWIKRDWLHLFPSLPDRTRLFRLFKKYWYWTNLFLAQPTILGVADSYGIELLHPAREGRSKKQIAKKGKSNYR
ncbi:MAG: transposase, partial [Anaerolineae bacterium]|nr:transposase [Anaerolineae bacterium]